MLATHHRTLVGLLCAAVLATAAPALRAESSRPDVPPAHQEFEAPVYPSPPADPRIRYVRTISDNSNFTPRKSWWKKILRGITGSTENATLVRPYGMAVRAGSVFICDPGARVVHVFYAADSSYIRIPGEGVLQSPIDVAVDPEGNVYVTDSKLGVVNCYDARGRFRFAFSGPLARPTGIAYHPGESVLYVVDTKADAVVVYTTDGNPVARFGKRGAGEGEFNFPVSISVGGGGEIYVTDAMNFRIQVFRPDGTFVRSFGRLGDGTGNFSKPKGVATDSDGNIYVADAIFDAVQVFDTDGRFLLSFGRTGQAPGEFWLPTGVTVDDRDRIYVADSYNNRVQVFQYLKD